MENNDLTALFNRLSWADRKKLEFSSAMKALTDFIREDGEKHPWKNPFYAAYLALLIVPVPVLPQATILLLGTVAWARLGNSEAARTVREKLHESADTGTIMKEYGPYVEPVPDGEGYRIRNLDLALKATRESWDATCRVYRGAGKVISGWFYSAPAVSSSPDTGAGDNLPPVPPPSPPPAAPPPAP